MGGVPPLDADYLRSVVAAVEAANGNRSEAARQMGIPVTTLKSQYHTAIKRGFDERIVREAPAGHRIKGVSTLYDAAGEIAAQWVKTTTDGLSLEDTIAAVKGALEEYRGGAVADIGIPISLNADLATVYPLADFHAGLLSWHRETGVDWDLSIAERVIGDAMAQLVEATPASAQGVVLGLGDLLHADNYDNQTSRSRNALDVDGRWPKVLQSATKLVIRTIELALAKHGKVLVRILPGNHDTQSAIAVSLALSMFYAGSERVTVDDDPSRFWWWSWGSVFLGASHGDQAKMKDLPLIMAARNPEAWGRAKFRHIYCGHIHTQTGIELAGVTVESFRTPVAPDAWHHGMGYGAGRSLTSITLHRDRGEIARSRVNIG